MIISSEKTTGHCSRNQDKIDFEKEMHTIPAIEVSAGITIEDILMLPDYGA